MKQRASALASRPFSPPPAIPEGLQKLSRDEYRRIAYRKNRAVWGGSPTRFSVELLAPGYLFRNLINVDVVENGVARSLVADRDSFDAPSEPIGALLAQAAQFAGFRLHYPLNRPDYADEFLVFRGATYFRGVSRGQVYGLSSRGLAIDVAEPDGEEFPIYRHFWIERPSARSESVVVHALLDSRRVTGAYRFGIYPGATLRINVDATLYPRARLSHVGFAPLTSMFMFGPMDRSGIQDYRQAVHDSQALAMINGRGEHLWRPLANPTTLQISQFVDENPVAFGLVQRNRDFARYQDLEDNYQIRPSAWIEPLGDWGPGLVQLVEIPSRSESNDNIVAYWRPKDGLSAGSPHNFSYRLSWPNDAPPPGALARVVYSGIRRVGDAADRQLVIDYAGGGLEPDSEVKVEASAAPGKLIGTAVHGNPKIGGVRIYVTFRPEDAKAVELRVQPTRNGGVVGETWLYRWTAE